MSSGRRPRPGSRRLAAQRSERPGCCPPGTRSGRWDSRRPRVGDHHGRNADGRQHLPHITLVEHVQHRRRRARAGRLAFVRGKSLDDGWVPGLARRETAQKDASSPAGADRLGSLAARTAAAATADSRHRRGAVRSHQREREPTFVPGRSPRRGSQGTTLRRRRAARSRSEPTASRTARMSSIHSSRVGRRPRGTGSDSPVPRLSRTMTRLNDASRSSIRANGGTAH